MIEDRVKDFDLVERCPKFHLDSLARSCVALREHRLLNLRLSGLRIVGKRRPSLSDGGTRLQHATVLLPGLKRKTLSAHHWAMAQSGSIPLDVSPHEERTSWVLEHQNQKWYVAELAVDS